jgi:bifunctional DNA-binding transcriptional regulator/antitoxin component of YhaV-PrlF toxin-antitoxin module
VPRFSAKLTSKNQLTLPAGVSAFLHAGPGDRVTFTVDDESGEVRVSGPDMEARLQAWAGRWVKDGAVGAEASEIDAWIRGLRGERD